MKTICVYLILVASILNSYAKTFYVSTSSGNDGYSLIQAQNPATPWKSLAKINSVIPYLKRGDIILFKRDDTFFGSLTINGSGTSGNSLTFGSYGHGRPPEISGLKDIDQWEKIGNNIWKARCITIKKINNLLVNGKPKPVGRHPNSNSLNGGYLNINTHTGKFKITTDRTINDKWTGAEAVVRSRRWILDRSLIKKQINNTFLLDSALTYEPDNNFGFFVQDNLNTLDVQHEWYFNQDTRELFLYSVDVPSRLHIQASVIEILFSFCNANNITVKDLTFNGPAKAAIEIKAGSNLDLNNLSIKNSGANAIDVSHSARVDIKKCSINHTYNNGISLYYSNNTTVAHNVLNNISTEAGMGKGGDMQYVAINVSGANNIIANNTIDSVGYIGIYFDGDHVTVENNRISNFCLIKDDGGGIYSFSKLPSQTNRIIRNNIIRNGIGMAEGTPYATPFASGIYLDDNASNIVINSNTISQCSHSGIYIRNSSNTTIAGNLIFDNAAQLKFMNDLSINTAPIKQTYVYSNTIISRHHNQPLLDFNLLEASVKDIGTFQDNRYIIPSKDSLQIRIQLKNHNTISRKLFAPLQWTNDYGKDSRSTFTILPFPPVYIQSLESGNLITAQTTAEKEIWLNAWSSHNNINLKSITRNGKVSEISFINPNHKKTNEFSSVFTQQFRLEKNKQYALHISIQSSLPEKDIYIKIREDKNSTHAALEDFVIAKNLNSSKWIFFTSKVNYDSARIYFEICEDSARTRLGNIELYEIRYNVLDIRDVLNIHTNSMNLATTAPPNRNVSRLPEGSHDKKSLVPLYSSVIEWKTPNQIDKAIYQHVIQAIQVRMVNRWQNNFTIIVIGVMVIIMLVFFKRRYWQYTTLAFIIFITSKVYFFDDNVKIVNEESIVLDLQGIKISKRQYFWPQIKQVTITLPLVDGIEANVSKTYSATNNNYIILQSMDGKVIKKRFSTKTTSEISQIKQIIDLLSFYKYPIKAINN